MRNALVFIALFVIGLVVGSGSPSAAATNTTFHNVEFMLQEVDGSNAVDLKPISNWIVAPGNWTDGSSSTVLNTNQTVTTTLAADVLFAFDKADLSTDAQLRLNDLADQIKSKGSKSVTIDGYTDSVGTDAYNIDLSQRRSESVRAALATQLPGVTFETNGHGAADPVATNDTDANRAKNRRVSVSY